MSEEAPYRHKSLRNPAINYRSGWWSVTIQVAKNKSIFGAIVGDKVVLNELGLAVEAYWRALPEKYPELEIFDFVVMPNHFHALVRIHFRPTNREHHLGFLMSRFKGGTSFIYGKRRRAGEVEDVGDQLWQRDYWDDLITSEAEFKGWQKYIRENPANWSSDRYGACTAYAMGDTELLNRPRIAFVASQGFFASELRPRKVWARGGAVGGATEVARPDSGGEADGVTPALSEGAASAAPKPAPKPARVLISTFTSAQEREALRRALINTVQPHDLVTQNERFRKLVFEENSFPFGKDGRSVSVKFFDYDDLANNDFVVTNQWTYPQTVGGKRLDVVLCVNGIPLVVGEIKTPFRPCISWMDGVKDISDYEKSISQMFVNDRIDLTSQMSSTFTMADVPNLVIADSCEELTRLLKTDARKIILTTIFKFQDVKGVLNSRDNIILLVDEAHRTQEGDLGGFTHETALCKNSGWTRVDG